MSTTEHLALARKWRPKTFSDVVGQDFTLQAIKNALDNNQLHHAYLFTGTRGVGKTTIARNFAKSLNCERGISSTPCGVCSNCLEINANRFVDLIEVDAASKTKVEDTRELLDKVHYAPSKGRYKVYLIDEVHMLSGHSFNALLKTLEEPPEHVKFLLATTDPQKLPATILSRCLQFHLTPLPIKSISQHLQFVLEQEGKTFEVEALKQLARSAQGSLRDALSLLEQALAYCDGHITAAQAQSMLGLIDPTAINDIINALIHQDPNQLLSASEQLAITGADFEQVLADLLERFHQISVQQAVVNSTTDKTIKNWASMITAEQTQLYYQITLLGRRDCSLAPNARMGFEMTLLRLLSFHIDTSNQLPASTSPSPATEKKTTGGKAPQAQSDPLVKKPETNTTVIPPSPETHIEPSQDNWAQWLPHLGLTGMTNSIARHCAIVSFDDKKLQLALEPSQAPLLQAAVIQRIEQAVCQYLKKTIVVDITSQSSEQPSPQQQEIQQQQQAQSERERLILADKNVKTIVETFDATVIKESIVEKT